MRALLVVVSFCLAGITSATPNGRHHAAAAASLREVPYSEDELVQAFISKRGDDLMGGLSGSVVKQMIKKFLDSPVVKKLATPAALEKYLNSDGGGGGSSIFTQDTFDMIINSDVVKQLMNPEMLKVIWRSKSMAQIMSKEFIMNILNNPLIAKVLSADMINKLLNADVVVNLINPDFLKAALDSQVAREMFLSDHSSEIAAGASYAAEAAKKGLAFLSETRAFKALMNPRFVEVLLYSDVGKAIFNPHNIINILNNDALANLISPEHVGMILNSPVVIGLVDPHAFVESLGTKTAKNLLSPKFTHEVLYSDLITKIAKPEHIISALNSPSVIAFSTGAEDYSNSPAFKALFNDAAYAAEAATETIKNFVKVPAWKNAIQGVSKAFTGGR